jgi:hypothetical protein
MLGDELLVGGDHVLARLQRCFHEGSRGLDAADDLDHHPDIGVVEQVLGVRGQQLGRQPGRVALRGVYVCHLAQMDRYARLPTQVLDLLGEQLDDPAADGSAADDSDSDLTGGHC